MKMPGFIKVWNDNTSYGEKVFSVVMCGLLIFALTMLTITWNNTPERAQMNAQKLYPDAKIVHVPGRKFSFIAQLRDGSIHQIDCLHLCNDDVSNDSILDGPNAETVWHDEAVKAGKAEYYLDEKNQKQWRWK